MTQGSTKKKKASAISAILVIGILAILLATILFLLLGTAQGELIAIGFLILYSFIILAIIIGIIIALHQRLKEIEKGEEEYAKRY